eukprot:2872398-Amphidinium_carterae.1
MLHEEGKAKDTGKLFYAKLTADYGVVSCDLTPLSFEESEDIPEEVLCLYTELLKSNPDRSIVATFCKGRTTVSESEMKILCHVLLALHLNGNGD